MTAAINEQMSEDFCPTHTMTPLKWSVPPEGGKAKPGDLVITLMDEDETESGAFGLSLQNEQRSQVRAAFSLTPGLKDATFEVAAPGRRSCRMSNGAFRDVITRLVP
jgi:hypothetical protein